MTLSEPILMCLFPSVYLLLKWLLNFFFIYFLTGLFEHYFLNICGVSLQILVSKREYLLHKQEKLGRLLVDIVAV